MNRFISLAGLVLLLVLAAVVSIRALREPEATHVAEPQVPRSAVAAESPAAKGGSSPRAAASAGSAAAPSTSYEQLLQSSSDYLEFVRSIHPAARAGDADAQYYLYRTLEYCHQQFRVYFGRPERPRTLDEGLLWATKNGPALDAEEGRRVHERCKALVDPTVKDLGTRDQWLELAATAGQPRAKVALASRRSLEAARLPEGDPNVDRVIADARALLVEALASRDPEAIYEAGLLQGLRQNVSDQDWVAWQIAACLRGLDCGPAAERTRMTCRFIPNCQPYESLSDMLRRYTADAASLDARAAEINRLIDAGDWVALGLESPP